VLLLSLSHTIDVDKKIGLEFCRPGGGAHTKLFWSPKTNTAKLHLMVRARRVVIVVRISFFASLIASSKIVLGGGAEPRGMVLRR
jgi:hypothetical protein